MAGHRFGDLDEEAVHGRRTVSWVRDGEPPILRGFDDAEAERRFVVADLAVFCTRTADVKAMLPLLKQRRIAGQDFTAYKGRTTRAVKVGTYHRAKGTRVQEGGLPAPCQRRPRPPTSRSVDPSEAEELARRQFFVGMTRACDRLVITWSGEVAVPCPLVEREHGHG